MSIPHAEIAAGLHHAMMLAAANPLRFDYPLDSPEYAARILALNASASTPSREVWPVDHGALAEQAEARVTMCLEAAARHAREARRLRRGAEMEAGK